MAVMSRLGRQLQEVIAALDRAGARHALIGGLALASHSVVRATQDIDLLVDLSMADAVDTELLRLGYHCLYRSADAANYLRGDERVDFLYAHRPLAQRLLAAAIELTTSLGRLHVVSPEGLIGFKLQGLGTFSCSTARHCWMNSFEKPDEAPLATGGGTPAPAPRVQDPYRALDELMAVVEALCPRWPERPTFSSPRAMLL